MKKEGGDRERNRESSRGRSTERKYHKRSKRAKSESGEISSSSESEKSIQFKKSKHYRQRFRGSRDYRRDNYLKKQVYQRPKRNESSGSNYKYAPPKIYERSREKSSENNTEMCKTSEQTKSIEKQHSQIVQNSSIHVQQQQQQQFQQMFASLLKSANMQILAESQNPENLNHKLSVNPQKLNPEVITPENISKTFQKQNNNLVQDLSDQLSVSTLSDKPEEDQEQSTKIMHNHAVFLKNETSTPVMKSSKKTKPSILFQSKFKKINNNGNIINNRTGNHRRCLPKMPFSLSIWSLQTIAYLLVTVIEKVVVFKLLAIDSLEVVFHDLRILMTAWFKNKYIEILIVLFIIPLILNIFMFWVVDNILMQSQGCLYVIFDWIKKLPKLLFCKCFGGCWKKRDNKNNNNRPDLPSDEEGIPVLAKNSDSDINHVISSNANTVMKKL